LKVILSPLVLLSVDSFSLSIFNFSLSTSLQDPENRTTTVMNLRLFPVAGQLCGVHYQKRFFPINFASLITAPSVIDGVFFFPTSNLNNQYLLASNLSIFRFQLSTVIFSIERR